MPALDFSKWSPGGNTTLFFPAAGLDAARQAELARQAHALGLNVWCYTGYTLEQLLQEADPNRMALLRETDVLVDGPFLLAQRSLELKYCGSRNQRLIDVKKTMSSGVPTLWEPPVW